MPSLRLANLIDGRLCAPQANRWLEVAEPATGACFAHCPDSTAADVDAAVAAAERAAPGSVLLAMLPDTGERYLSTFLLDDVAEGSDDAWLEGLEVAPPGGLAAVG